MLFRDDRKDFDACFRDVIEHPDLMNPEAILRPFDATEPLDAAAAHLRGLVTEVEFDRLTDPATDVRPEGLELPYRRGGEDDLEPHSGQIIARS